MQKLQPEIPFITFDLARVFLIFLSKIKDKLNKKHEFEVALDHSRSHSF